MSYFLTLQINLLLSFLIPTLGHISKPLPPCTTHLKGDPKYIPLNNPVDIHLIQALTSLGQCK